jgi:cytidylate kinase
MDGRDIGTIVFPNTPHKFFLTASPEVRAKRRLDELNSKGIAADYESVYQDMVKRDYSDENRKIAPLVRSKDALLVDTDSLSIKVVIETILSGVSNVSS